MISIGYGSLITPKFVKLFNLLNKLSLESKSSYCKAPNPHLLNNLLSLLNYLSYLKEKGLNLYGLNPST